LVNFTERHRLKLPGSAICHNYPLPDSPKPSLTREKHREPVTSRAGVILPECPMISDAGMVMRSLGCGAHTNPYPVSAP